MFFPKFCNILFILLLATCLIGCPSQGNDGGDDFVEGTDTLPPPPTPAVTGPGVDTPEETTQLPATAFTFEIQVDRVNGTGFFSASVALLSGTVTGLPTTISFSALTQIADDPITFESTGTFLAPLSGSGTVLVTVTYNGEGAIAPYCFSLGVGVPGGGTATCGTGGGGGGAGGGGGGSGPFDFSGVYVSDCAQLDVGSLLPCASDPANPDLGFFYFVIDHDPIAGTAGFLFCGPNEDAGDSSAGICIYTSDPAGLSTPVTLTSGAGGAMTLTFTDPMIGDCGAGGLIGPFPGTFTFTMTPPVGAGEPTALFTFPSLGAGPWTGPAPLCPQSGLTRTFTRTAGTTGTTTDLPFSYSTLTGGCSAP